MNSEAVVQQSLLCFGAKAILSWLNDLANRSNLNGNDNNLNYNNRTFGMTFDRGSSYMKTYNNLYPRVYSLDNLLLAWRRARKRKTKRRDIIEFEENLEKNLLDLYNELKLMTYSPRKLQTFTLRDPKTRKISKSDFRDRVIHHALINIIGITFEKRFIYDSCAGIKDKGTLFALKRFEEFKRRVCRNCNNIKNKFNDKNFVRGYCFKADIKHYFQEVNHNILIDIIRKRIKDENVMWLIKQILNANSSMKRERENNIRI